MAVSTNAPGFVALASDADWAGIVALAAGDDWADFLPLVSSSANGSSPARAVSQPKAASAATVTATVADEITTRFEFDFVTPMLLGSAFVHPNMPDGNVRQSTREQTRWIAVFGGPSEVAVKTCDVRWIAVPSGPACFAVTSGPACFAVTSHAFKGGLGRLQDSISGA